MDKGIRDKVIEALTKNAPAALKVLPLWMEAIGAGVFISEVLQKNPRLKDRLAELEDRVFLFEAIDIKKSFYLLIKGRDVKVVPHMNRKPDVTMRGKVNVLMDVLMGREDPDTVFFSRRIEITGDTAIAIRFKNILASL